MNRHKAISDILVAWTSHNSNIAAGKGDDALRIVLALDALGLIELEASRAATEQAEVAPTSEQSLDPTEAWASKRTRT